ncbi:hypothetical protein Tco_1073964 [Tanacetum coccineum]
MKETIRIEYEWEPPRCITCLVYGHSLVYCPKAPKRVVNMMDKGKGQTSRADEEGFMEMKRKKSGGNNGGNKNFKQVSLKPKTLYHPKAKQLAKGMSNSPKTTPFVGTNKALKSCNNKDCTKSSSKKCYGFSDDINLFSLSNSSEALNVKNPVIEEVVTGNMATTSGTQNERRSTTPLAERINVLEKQMLKGKLVLLDDNRKQLKKVDYSGNTCSEDEVEPIDNETVSFLASKPIGLDMVPRASWNNGGKQQ